MLAAGTSAGDTGTDMSIIGPKFVMLDTATIAQAAANPGDRSVKVLLAMLRSGDWIPYFTWHHLEELISHENADVFKRRADLLARLPHLAHLRQPGNAPCPYMGSATDVRDYEITFLADHPGESHQEVVGAVWSYVRGGFCSGEEFIKANMDWWCIFRPYLAEVTRIRKEQVANTTHFPTTDLKRRLPAKGQSPGPCSPEESAKRYAALARQLEQKIIECGDCRNVDPKAAASKLMREAYEDTLPLLKSGGDFIDEMMKRDGVSRDRLPPKPTVEDMCDEAVFVAQMGVHARRLLRPKDELLRLVRKEQIPSWLIWREVDRRLKQLPRAEVGNINDKHILAFGPYVEVVNVDKRIADLLRQAAHDHDLLSRVYERVPKARGLAGLIAHMKKK